MGLYEDIWTEPCRQLRLRELVPLDPTTPIRDAIAALRDRRLGCAIVVDAVGRPTGMFTERSLTRALAGGALSLDDPVATCLDPELSTVALYEPIARMLDAMNQRGTRFVCIVDAGGKAVAITGQKGLMECLAEYFPRQVNVMARRVGVDAVSRKREGG